MIKLRKAATSLPQIHVHDTNVRPDERSLRMDGRNPTTWRVLCESALLMVLDIQRHAALGGIDR
jgi:hypothetical protein